MNSSPNLPMLMLWIQFILAVICLHVSALFTPKIELPKAMLTMSQLKQLAPILIVNVVGLTFNTLCLRGVDASFFQVMHLLHLLVRLVGANPSFLDCERLGPSSNNNYLCRSCQESSVHLRYCSCCHCHGWLFCRRRTIQDCATQFFGIVSLSHVRRHFLLDDCGTRCSH